MAILIKTTAPVGFILLINKQKNKINCTDAGNNNSADVTGLKPEFRKKRRAGDLL